MKNLKHHETPPNTDEEKPEMVEGSNSNLVRCSSSSSSSSSRRTRTGKMMKNADFDSLPEDILMEILVRIPAQDIFDAALFVCRKWCQMVRTHDFTYSHLRHSTSGFLIRHRYKCENSFMSMTQDGQIQVSTFTYNPEHRFWSSCNGLLLEPHFRDCYELVLANPVTKQRLALPPFINRTLSPHHKSAIAFVDKRMEYKVVRAYCMGFPDQQARVYCGILTVGVDNSWRLVDTKHLSHADSGVLNTCPLVTDGGFAHWAEDMRGSPVLSFNKEKGIITTGMRSNYVLTMNMETEIITRILAPQCSGGYYYYYKYLSGGRYLSLLIGCGYLKWEVWEMKPEMGEWTKLPDIDLETHKGLLNELYDKEESQYKPDDGACLDCKLAPAGWLKYPEVIIFVAYRPTRSGDFCQARLRVVYNVQTQDISMFGFDYNPHPYLVHTNSLMGIC